MTEYDFTGNNSTDSWFSWPVCCPLCDALVETEWSYCPYCGGCLPSCLFYYSSSNNYVGYHTLTVILEEEKE